MVDGVVPGPSALLYLSVRHAHFSKMVAQRYLEKKKKKKRKENTLITFAMVTHTLNKHNINSWVKLKQSYSSFSYPSCSVGRPWMKGSCKDIMTSEEFHSLTSTLGWHSNNSRYPGAVPKIFCQRAKSQIQKSEILKWVWSPYNKSIDN